MESTDEVICMQRPRSQRCALTPHIDMLLVCDAGCMRTRQCESEGLPRISCMQ